MAQGTGKRICDQILAELKNQEQPLTFISQRRTTKDLTLVIFIDKVRRTIRKRRIHSGEGADETFDDALKISFSVSPSGHK